MANRLTPAPTPARPAVPMPPKEAQPRRVVAAPPPIAERKPAAVPAPAPAGPPPAPKVHETPKPVQAAVAAVVEGPPPTENFRRDLLQIVSERTGYPVDMLDETLPLEAGLGIDSIKTVEIFSKLKEYHVFFREGVSDEEELLAEFTQLKTLQDIVNSYDRHRQAYGATPTNGQNGNGAAHPAHADKKPHSAVERFAVAATEAPLDGNGAKKNFLNATSS
jgi:acyl carrier protein